MNHFTNQSNGSHCGYSLMGRAMLRRFALFPMMLLMLLLLPARMAAHTEASSSKYIATYDSDTETLTFEKYEGESLPSNSAWVKDGTMVFNEFFDLLRQKTIKHIVLNESFKTFTPTTLSGFFANLINLETITGLEYLNTANVTNMSSLFYNCRKLTSLDLSHFNTAKVTDMYKMFDSCGLTSLDLSSFNTAKVTGMESMFSGCSNLKTIYASGNFFTTGVTFSKDMFASCNSLSGDIDWTSDKATDKTYAKIDGGYFRDKAYDNRPWVKYADGTLTFRCGYKKTLGENEYALNSGENLPAWETNKKNISQVVFEASFANARPTSCYAWFQDFWNLTQIEGIENLNTENVTSMAYMFSSCKKLAELDVTHFNTANVKNMKYMFYLCKGLTSLDVTHFNTANVKDMTSMFYSCNGLTSLDVTNFNTANVTSMSFMFCNCYELTSLDITNFNTANVTDMGYMFFSCYNLKEIYVSDKFVTDAVKKCYQMFAYCESLSGDIDWTSDKATDKTYAKIDGGYFRDKAYDNRPWVKYADGTLTFRCGYKKTLGENEYLLNSGKELPKWYVNNTNTNTNLVVFDASFANARPTSCYAWFLGFNKLKQIEGIENLNTENVTNMACMFKGCSSLTSLDVTHFNTGNVTSMYYMFTLCSNLAELDVTHFNTEKVTDMFGMFSSCKGLISLDVTNFNTANVKEMSYMFYNCYKLKEIYVSDKFVTDAVISSDNMFSGCNSLSGDIDWSDKAVDKTYAKTDGGYFRDKAYDNHPWVKYADGTLTFLYGYKKTLGENGYELNSGTHLPAWYGKSGNITKAVFDASFANARPTSCCMWFQDFKNLTQIEGIENLNTTNVTNMTSMFYGCSQLTSLDVTHFNTEKVTNMDQMFTDCRCLTSLDVTNFNTANVTNMSYMFYGCSQLTSLDVTNFNTANVSGMNHMFFGCSSLTSLDVTNFNTENVLVMNDMFSGCSSLTSLDVSHFNTKNVEYIMNIFKGCSALTTIYASDKFVMDKAYKESVDMFKDCTNLKGAITEYDESKTDYHFANYKTGYFTKLVGKNGDEKIGATGETLVTENLLLDDNKDFVAYEPFAAKAASYSRTINAGTKWATLCLPFEVSLANQKFRAFKLLSADDAAETVELEEIETSIAAGTPVIIKMKDGETKLSFTVANKEIANEVKTAETANSNYQLQGLYTQKVFSKDTDNNCYIVKGEKLMNPAKLLEKTATKSVGSKPFRAYMVDKSSAPVAGARMFSIRIGDGTTAIKQLEADAADAADGKAEYYDLQGHRLQDLQKGVNIVKRGGKTMKVVIK